MKNVVFLGGGHSNTLSIRSLMKKIIKIPPSDKNKILSNFNFHLISEYNKSAYSGMIPGSICQYYSAQDSFLDLAKFSEIHKCNFIQKKVKSIKPADNLIVFEDHSTMNYDLLSINVGSRTSNAKGVKGVDQFALQTRPINKLLGKIENFERKENNKQRLKIGIVGSGVSGIELAFSLHYRFKNTMRKDSSIVIFSNEKNIIPDLERNVVEELVTLAEINDIKIRQNCECVEISEEEIIYKDNNERNRESIRNFKRKEEKLDLAVWATGAGPQEINESSNLALDSKGFILVKNTLQSINYDNIFASGDCIQMDKYKNDSFPCKSGVYAVREGAVLAENIFNIIDKKDLIEYKPQKNFLKLITMGNKTAYGTKFGIGFYGKWVWNLKEFIDVNFVKMFYKDLSYENTTIADVINSHVTFSFSPEGCIEKLKNSKEEIDFTIQLKIIDRLSYDEDLLFKIKKLL